MSTAGLRSLVGLSCRIMFIGAYAGPPIPAVVKVLDLDEGLMLIQGEHRSVWVSCSLIGTIEVVT